MSLMARLMNVFAIPGDVFAEVRLRAASVANWLAPALLTTLVMALTSLIVMSQPAIQQKIREQQEQALEKYVQSGRITREKADQQLAMIEKFSGPMKLVGSSFAGVMYGFGRMFWWATVLWLLGRSMLRARFPYVKAMEVAGLAGMIGVLGLIVTLLLQINFSDPNSSPSLALLVDKFDTKNIGHLVLAAANVFHIWQAVVLAIALSRLAQVPLARAIFVFLPFWLLLQSAMIAVSAGVARMMG